MPSIWLEVEEGQVHFTISTNKVYVYYIPNYLNSKLNREPSLLYNLDVKKRQTYKESIVLYCESIINQPTRKLQWKSHKSRTKSLGQIHKGINVYVGTLKMSRIKPGTCNLKKATPDRGKKRPKHSTCVLFVLEWGDEQSNWKFLLCS